MLFLLVFTHKIVNRTYKICQEKCYCLLIVFLTKRKSFYNTDNSSSVPRSRRSSSSLELPSWATMLSASRTCPLTSSWSSSRGRSLSHSHTLSLALPDRAHGKQKICFLFILLFTYTIEILLICIKLCLKSGQTFRNLCRSCSHSILFYNRSMFYINFLNLKLFKF